ncbi:unnamed protein product [Lota lota]
MQPLTSSYTWGLTAPLLVPRPDRLYPECTEGVAFTKLSDLKRHRKLHDKEKTFLDQPSCPQSATSLAEPEIELSETSSDTTQNCTLDPSLQLKPEDPGPSTLLCFEDTASTPLPVLTTAVDTHHSSFVTTCDHSNSQHTHTPLCSPFAQQGYGHLPASPVTPTLPGPHTFISVSSRPTFRCGASNMGPSTAVFRARTWHIFILQAYVCIS